MECFFCKTEIENQQSVNITIKDSGKYERLVKACKQCRKIIVFSTFLYLYLIYFCFFFSAIVFVSKFEALVTAIISCLCCIILVNRVFLFYEKKYGDIQSDVEKLQIESSNNLLYKEWETFKRLKNNFNNREVTPFIFFGAFLIAIFSIFIFSYPFSILSSYSFNKNKIVTLVRADLRDRELTIESHKGGYISLGIKYQLTCSKLKDKDSVVSDYSYSVSNYEDKFKYGVITNKYILNAIYNAKWIPLICDSKNLENRNLLLTKADFEQFNLNRDSIIHSLSLSEKDKANYFKLTNLLDSFKTAKDCKYFFDATNDIQ